MKSRWLFAQFITRAVAFYSILPFLFAFVNESRRWNACALMRHWLQQRWCVVRQIKYSATCREIMTELACQRRSRIIVPDAALVYCEYMNREQQTICKNTKADKKKTAFIQVSYSVRNSMLFTFKIIIGLLSGESCYKEISAAGC